MKISQSEIAEAERLINSNAECSILTEGQLEVIGEYFMERMHPGEAHEFMDKRMGLEEGTAEEKRFHANLAKAMYCGDNADYGMMGGGVRGNMMRSMMGYDTEGAGYGFGMMGNYGYRGFYGWSVFEILLLILLAGLIVLVYLHVWRKAERARK